MTHTYYLSSHVHKLILYAHRSQKHNLVPVSLHGSSNSLTSLKPYPFLPLLPASPLHCLLQLSYTDPGGPLIPSPGPFPPLLQGGEGALIMPGGRDLRASIDVCPQLASTYCSLIELPSQYCLLAGMTSQYCFLPDLPGF